MYTLTEQQIDSVKTFIENLPESTVKGNYERWLLAIKEDGRLPVDELEKFVSLANGLPHEFQNFPQNFSLSVKNGVEPENISVDETEEDEEEVHEPKKKKAVVKKLVKKTKK